MDSLTDHTADLPSKPCSVCKQVKPLTDYYGRSAAKDGHQHYCKKCQNKSRAEWGRKNPEKHKRWKSNPKRDRRPRRNTRLARYGMTSESYESLLASQCGRCAACGRGVDGTLHIDHDHGCCSSHRRSCGSCVRGLLCPTCNLALGLLADDPLRIDALSSYIRRTRKGGVTPCR